MLLVQILLSLFLSSVVCDDKQDNIINDHTFLPLKEIVYSNKLLIIEIFKLKVDRNYVDEFVFLFDRVRLYPSILSSIRSMTVNNTNFSSILSKYMIYNNNYSDHYVRVGRFLLRSRLLESLPNTIDELKYIVCESYNRDISFYLKCSDDSIEFTQGINKRRIGDIIFVRDIPEIVYSDQLKE